MNSRSAIFTVILVLLVPLAYSSFATNEACALGTEDLTNKKCTFTNYLKTEKTCCGLVTSDLPVTPSPKKGSTGQVYCEDCKKNYKGEWVCEKPYQRSQGSLPDDQQDSLDVKPTPPPEPKFPRGDILPDDGEPTINDPPTTTEPKELDPGKIKIPGKIESPNLK